jgi:3-phenylpropionate/cinnamic acid dioxygenase small subunit
MNAPLFLSAPKHLADYDVDEGTPVPLDRYYEVQRFYFREARLQNGRQARAWLQTMVDRDIHYWLPVWEERYLKDPRPQPGPADAAVYSDDYDDLDMRISRLETGLVWMEDPPARNRFLVSNIEAFDLEEGLIGVYSNVHVYRNRRQRDEFNHFYGREDLLRRGADGQLRLFRRKIALDQRVVLDKNLYFFL